jgi:formylglycine-generating enzyme
MAKTTRTFSRITGMLLALATTPLAAGQAVLPEAPRAATPPALDDGAINALIAQLGDPSYPVREQATKKLQAAGLSAYPAVKAALQSAADSEVQSRLHQIEAALASACLWNGTETIAEYARRMDLPAAKTVPLGLPFNQVEMHFALIPAGEFTMGSPNREPERLPGEAQHKVRISRAFFMQTTPVTQAQWKALMPRNPARFQGDTLPVESVTWKEAVKFCQALSAQDDKTYRLPTEAEWEFACRAGTTTPFNFGNSISPTVANYNASVPYGNSASALFRVATTPVETFKPNGWGLYDMHGNVWQWCSDWYADYPAGDTLDPAGPAQGDGHVARGGSWVDIARFLRSACRGREATPDGESIQTGFRVVLELGK